MNIFSKNGLDDDDDCDDDDDDNNNNNIYGAFND
jgi:hypothetical protein